MAEDVHIGVNRSRLLIHMVFFTLLGIGGLIGFFALADSTESSSWIWQGCGIAVCLLAVIAAGSKAKKRGDASAGITFTNEGIIDNASDIGIGMIKWKDIKGIDREVSLKNRLLIIDVKRHGDYLKKSRNSAITRLLQQNIRNFDTPVVIEAAHLEVSLTELLDIAINARNKRL